MLEPLLRKLIPAIDKLASTEAVQRHLGHFVPIFVLHRLHHPDYGIQGQSPQRIREQLEHFRRRGFCAISLLRLGEMLRAREKPPYRSAVFTIDDGFIDHHDIAGPLFAEYDIPLTYFLITDFIDRKLWPWDDQLGYAIARAEDGEYCFALEHKEFTFRLVDDSSRNDAIAMLMSHLKQVDNTDIYEHISSLYQALGTEMLDEIPCEHQPMNWDQANGLCRQGHHVAAHTCSHRILSRLDAETASAEIATSIDRVNKMVNNASNVFAYPTGRASDFSTREFALLEDKGIAASVTTIPSPYIYNESFENDIHQLPRLGMPSSLPDFIQYLSWMEYMKHRLR